MQPYAKHEITFVSSCDKINYKHVFSMTERFRCPKWWIKGCQVEPLLSGRNLLAALVRPVTRWMFCFFAKFCVKSFDTCVFKIPAVQNFKQKTDTSLSTNKNQVNGEIFLIKWLPSVTGFFDDLAKLQLLKQLKSILIF